MIQSLRKIVQMCLAKSRRRRCIVLVFIYGKKLRKKNIKMILLDLFPFGKRTSTWSVL